ncbi:smp-like protein [Vibrio ishigakensis]|uniref:Smp-like protein n=1 Tax=Vibrio ishigakensis TaxID=1481914 RepID=A0A0B8PF85_9VIBR|nr:smp-like protein [Vibrio ishigakensis]
MFATIVRSSVFISQGNQQIQFKQLQTLTQLLISQASLNASELIVKEDQENLRHLANRLAKETLVTDVTIYDSKGVKIAASDKAKTVRESLGLDTPLASAAIGKQQLIEPSFPNNPLLDMCASPSRRGSSQPSLIITTETVTALYY